MDRNKVAKISLNKLKMLIRKMNAFVLKNKQTKTPHKLKVKDWK